MTHVAASNPRADVRAGAHAPSRPGVHRFSSAHFLVALVLLIVVDPFVEEIEYGDWIEAALLTLVLLSAVLAVGGPPRTLRWAVVLVIPALVAKWASHLSPDRFPQEVGIAAGLVFVGFVVQRLFRYILLARRVNADVLCAGIASYLTLGLLWAMGYVLLARIVPGAFDFTQTHGSRRAMTGATALYFSFVTLSTVGYGDIVPASAGARVLAMTEATTGTLYVAVLIARLVTLYAATGVLRGTARIVDDDAPGRPGDA